MDLTEVFASQLKTIKTVSRDVNLIKQVRESKNNDSEKRTPVTSNYSFSKQFIRKLKKLIETITKMKEFLVVNRKDYVNIYSPLLSKVSSMTDLERDKIDHDVQKFMISCKEILRNLFVENETNNGQIKEHNKCLINMTEDYLKHVCDIYSQQKAIRVRRAFDKQKMSRLSSTFITGTLINTSVRSQNHNNNNNNNSSKQNGFIENQQKSLLNEINSKQIRPQLSPSMSIGNDLANYDEKHLTAAEIQIFKQENEQILQEMNALVDDVEKMEGSVVEIARLQQFFTEKVLQQEQDLNRLNDATVNSTENVRGGNDQLREAMKKNAGFRVWLLFFIITLTFTILFLDWYNP